MNTTAIIISIIALLGAAFAFLRAVSAYNMLTKRINRLKEQNSDLESRLRRLEGNASRGNRASSGEPGEGGAQKRQRHEQQPEQRQKQRERQQPQPQRAEDVAEQQQPPKRRKDKRRRNEPAERNNPEGREKAVPATASEAVRMEFVGSDLLDELEREAAGATPPPVQPEAVPEAAPDTGTRFAIIPEDGVIRQHQLQHNPDSDSYIEMDLPADGSSTTRYRFNLSGNHAFVIAQGIDRLENAFAFEKPSNRMVSRVVLQGDGILTKVNNGWRIQEKARIDFR